MVQVTDEIAFRASILALNAAVNEFESGSQEPSQASGPIGEVLKRVGQTAIENRANETQGSIAAGELAAQRRLDDLLRRLDELAGNRAGVRSELPTGEARRSPPAGACPATHQQKAGRLAAPGASPPSPHQAMSVPVPVPVLASPGNRASSQPSGDSKDF